MEQTVHTQSPPQGMSALEQLRVDFPQAQIAAVISQSPECDCVWATAPLEHRGNVIPSQLIYIFAPFESSDLRVTFLQIAEKLASLDAPGIIPLLSSGEKNGRHFLSFGCPRGSTLNQLSNGATVPMDSTQVLFIARTVASSLSKLHETGLYHGGINLDNILVTENQVPLLLAPGIEKIFERPPNVRMERAKSIAQHNQFCLAPEQLDPCMDVGPFCDIHALGALLFSLITGCKLGVAFKLASSSGNLETKIDDIINTCLDATPVYRKYDAKALGDVLASVHQVAPSEETGPVAGADSPVETEEQRVARAQAAAQARAQAKAEADARARAEAEAEKQKAMAKAASWSAPMGSAGSKKATKVKAKEDTKSKEKARAKRGAKALAELKAKAEARERDGEIARIAQEKASAEAAVRAEAEAREREAAARAQYQAEAEAKIRAAALAQKKAEEQAQAMAMAQARAEENARAEAKARAEAEARAAEARAMAQAEAQARAKAETAAKARAQAEAQARAKVAAEAKARAEAEARAKIEAAARAKAEKAAAVLAKAEAKVKAKADARAHKLAIARAKAEAKERAKARIEEERRREQEARQAKARAEAEARAKAAAEEKAKRKAEEEARQKAEAEARAKAEAAVRVKAEAEARARAEAAVRAKAEAEARAKAEAAERAKAEARARAKAETEAKARSKEEAERKQKRLKAEAKAAEEAKAKAKKDARVRKARLKVEAKAKAAGKEMAERAARVAEQKRKAEDKARAAAKVKADEEARLEAERLETKIQLDTRKRQKEEAASRRTREQAKAKAVAQETGRRKAEAKTVEDTARRVALREEAAKKAAKERAAAQSTATQPKDKESQFAARKDSGKEPTPKPKTQPAAKSKPAAAEQKTLGRIKESAGSEKLKAAAEKRGKESAKLVEAKARVEAKSRSKVKAQARIEARMKAKSAASGKAKARAGFKAEKKGAQAKLPRSSSSKKLVGGALLGLFIVGGLLWSSLRVYEAQEGEITEAKLDQLEEYISTGKLESARSELSDVLENVGTDIERVEEVMVIAVRGGVPELAGATLQSHLASLPGDTSGKDELSAFAAGFVSSLKAHSEAMDEAAKALDSGNDQREHKFLQDALRALPNEGKALATIAKNPIYVTTRLKQLALEVLAEQETGKTLHISSHVERGNISLNLSGNPNLKNISFLKGIHLDELDISRTAVADLSPISEMKLQRLWFDDTPVADLSAVAGMPLEGLSFERTRVTKLDILDSLPQLKMMRYLEPGTGALYFDPGQTAVAGDRWENALGLRFLPLLGWPKTLMSTTPVTVRDFAAFVKETNHPMPERTFIASGNKDEPGAEKSISWNSPELAPQTDLPVVGVSSKDAEAFCKWLTARELEAGHIPRGAEYRLPSDSEWSAAAGIVDVPWQQASARVVEGRARLHSLHHRFRVPASQGPGVDSFRGLVANVREWTSSPYNDGGNTVAVRGAALPLAGDRQFTPADSTVFISTHGDSSIPKSFNSAASADRLVVDLRQRTRESPDAHRSDVGFRIVLSHRKSPRIKHPIGRFLEQGKHDAAIASAHLLVRYHDGPESVDDNAFLRATRLLLLLRSTDELEHQQTFDPAVIPVAQSLVALGAIRDSFKSTGRFPGELDQKLRRSNGKRYLLVRAPLAYDTARKFAESAGGRLAAVEDDQALEIVRDVALAKGIATYPAVWVSGGTEGGQQAPILASANGSKTRGEFEVHQRPGTERHAFVIEWD